MTSASSSSIASGRQTHTLSLHFAPTQDTAAMVWTDQYLELLNLAVPPPSQIAADKPVEWSSRAMKAFRLVDLGR